MGSRLALLRLGSEQVEEGEPRWVLVAVERMASRSN
jgi:hypothetical protein